MQYFLVALVLWLSSLMASVSVAASVETPVDKPKIQVGLGVEFLEDKEGSRTLESVRNDPSWQTSAQAVFNKDYNASTWWLKFEVKNVTDSNRWLLDISYAVLDELDLFVLQQDGALERFELGDKRPFHQRPIDHRNFVVPLNIPPHEEVTIFMRLKTTSSVQVPISLWEERAFF